MLQSFENDTNLSNIDVIACDMDFTLLADDKSMPDDMDARITALHDAGITFAAASGRPLYTLSDMFGDLHDRMAFISDNGAAVVCRDEVVFKSLIDPEVVQELTEFTAYDEVFRTFYYNITYVDSLDHLDAEVNKFTVYIPDATAVPLCESVFRPAFGDRLSVTCGGSVWIDIMNYGVDKGTGLARLCEHLGVAQADAAAFGDTDNDVQMLEWANHSYLMANAEERMEPHARFRAPSNNDRGVAVVVDRILDARHAARG